MRSKRGRTKWRRDILNRASSLEVNLKTGEIGVLEKEPSYRDGARMYRDRPKAERFMIYMEIIKDADNGMSEDTKKKIRKSLNLEGLDVV